jgi:FkbM family methyltransferase
MTEELQNHLRNLSNQDLQPVNHKNYLIKLKESGFEPKVIYDIGSCVLHWTTLAKTQWPDAKFILFDAFSAPEFLYKEGQYDYHIGILSDEDDVLKKFYQNDYHPGGNSYYREIGFGETSKMLFTDNGVKEMITKKLDTVVKERGFPLPDFVKIDVQGAEIDVIQGGVETLKNAKRLIVELQHVEYNEGALKANESLPIIESLGWKCDAPLFQNNGPDGDYSFVKM